MSAMLRRSQWSHAQQEKLRGENRRREEFIEDNHRMLKTEAMVNANILAEEKVGLILIVRCFNHICEYEDNKRLSFKRS